MNTPSFCNKDWNYAHNWNGPHGLHRPHGRPFAPLQLIFGLLVLLFLFKTGLWLPLLGLGVLAYTFFGLGAMRHWQQWQQNFGDEKPKRGHGPMHGPWWGPTDPQAEKPKRDVSDDAFV